MDVSRRSLFTLAAGVGCAVASPAKAKSRNGTISERLKAGFISVDDARRAEGFLVTPDLSGEILKASFPK